MAWQSCVGRSIRRLPLESNERGAWGQHQEGGTLAAMGVLQALGRGCRTEEVGMGPTSLLPLSAAALDLESCSEAPLSSEWVVLAGSENGSAPSAGVQLKTASTAPILRHSNFRGAVSSLGGKQNPYP